MTTGPNIVLVGVGEMGISSLPNEVIKTYGLGSCVAVVAIAPRLRTAALLHVALPHSSIDPRSAARLPTRFADTGIPIMMKALAEKGCNRGDIIIKLAGGASVLNIPDVFHIGSRNVAAVEEILHTYRLYPAARHVGGHISRTVAVEVGTGRVIISSPGMEKCEL